MRLYVVHLEAGPAGDCTGRRAVKQDWAAQLWVREFSQQPGWAGCRQSSGIIQTGSGRARVPYLGETGRVSSAEHVFKVPLEASPLARGRGLQTISIWHLRQTMDGTNF